MWIIFKCKPNFLRTVDWRLSCPTRTLSTPDKITYTLCFLEIQESFMFIWSLCWKILYSIFIQGKRTPPASKESNTIQLNKNKILLLFYLFAVGGVEIDMCDIWPLVVDLFLKSQDILVYCMILVHAYLLDTLLQYWVTPKNGTLWPDPSFLKPVPFFFGSSKCLTFLS